MIHLECVNNATLSICHDSIILPRFDNTQITFDMQDEKTGYDKVIISHVWYVFIRIEYQGWIIYPTKVFYPTDKRVNESHLGGVIVLSPMNEIK